MRLLAATDIHGKDKRNIQNLLERKNYDLLLIVGDITQFGPVSKAEKILDDLKNIDIPILALPGNCDPREVVDVLEGKEVNLHSKSSEIDGYLFVGLGGSNPTPFDTPFELSEKKIGKELEKLIPDGLTDWILVTHAPPYGTKCDLTSDGTHAGSKAIKKIIEDKDPLINFCGHIHEARSIDEIGETKIVNPGPISECFGAEALIDGEVEVDLIKV